MRERKKEVDISSFARVKITLEFVGTFMNLECVLLFQRLHEMFTTVVNIIVMVCTEEGYSERQISKRV